MAKKSTKATFIIYGRQIHSLRTDAIFGYDKNVEHASELKKMFVNYIL